MHASLLQLYKQGGRESENVPSVQASILLLFQIAEQQGYPQGPIQFNIFLTTQPVLLKFTSRIMATFAGAPGITLRVTVIWYKISSLRNVTSMTSQTVSYSGQHAEMYRKIMLALKRRELTR